MPKKWICKFWFHDWEVIEQLTETELKFTIERRMGLISETRRPPISPENDKIIDRRVCIRCGTKKDSINDYFTKYLKSKKDEEERKKQASKLWSTK